MNRQAQNRVKVTDVLGQVLMEQSLYSTSDGSVASFSTASLTPGVYIAHLIDFHGVAVGSKLFIVNP
jgi:hypothetical protein